MEDEGGKCGGLGNRLGSRTRLPGAGTRSRFIEFKLSYLAAKNPKEVKKKNHSPS